MGQHNGMSTLALRFFNTYGAGQALTPYVGVITIFLNRILSGQPPVIFGDGEQCRDFVHVRDVAYACLLGVESGSTGQSVNIGTGKGTTVNQVASMLLHRLGSSLVPQFRPARCEENRNSIGDIRLASKLLGYRSTYDLASTLDDLLSSGQNFKLGEG
jgi:nucleoside-diphosphate-sugar epimerase